MKNSINVLTTRLSYASISTLVKNQYKNLNERAKKMALNIKKNTNIKGGIISLLMLLVVISIAFSSYVVYFGAAGLAPKIMLVPQVLFAAGVLVSKFSK